MFGDGLPLPKEIVDPLRGPDGDTVAVDALRCIRSALSAVALAFFAYLWCKTLAFDPHFSAMLNTKVPGCVVQRRHVVAAPLVDVGPQVHEQLHHLNVRVPGRTNNDELRLK